MWGHGVPFGDKIGCQLRVLRTMGTFYFKIISEITIVTTNEGLFAFQDKQLEVNFENVVSPKAVGSEAPGFG